MVRRYVLGGDARKLDAKTVTLGGPAGPTGTRRLATLPGLSDKRPGKELRTK